ncbi:MAG: oligosaccharide flippase family protein [Candidatus Bathyarchaeia archaeon]
MESSRPKSRCWREGKRANQDRHGNGDPGKTGVKRITKAIACSAWEMRTMALKTRAQAWVTDQIKRLLPKGEFGRGVAVLTGGTALGQAVTVLASPILTRLYTPDDFGVLAVYSSILNVFSVIASWRYEMALPLPEKDELVINLVTLSLGIAGLMSLLMGLGVGLLGDHIVWWINAPILRSYLWLLPMGIFLVGSYQVFNYWAVRQKDFSVIAKTRLYQGIGSGFTQIVAGLLNIGPVGLLIGHILGQSAGLFTLALRFFKHYKITALNINNISFVARRYKRFPLLSVWPAFINSLGLQLPILALSGLYGAQVTGWFALTNRVFGVPLAIVSASTASVFVGQAAEYLRSGKKLDILFWKVIRQQSFIGIPMLLFVPLSLTIFSSIFGQNWEQSGIYASVWIPAIVANFIASPTGGILDILERQDLFVFRELCRLIMIGGTVALSIKLSLPPFVMLSMLSSFMVLFAFVYASLSLYAIKRADND